MSNYHQGSFTNGYEGYWRKSRTDVESAIKKSVIIPDTNALLSLYRMEISAREEYFEVLKALSPRIWVPRQVADEFHRNRISSLDSHVNALKEKSKGVNDSIEGLRKALKDLAKLRALAGPKVRDYMEPFNNILSGIESRVSDDLANFDLDASRLASHDPILEKLSILLDGKVGNTLTEEKGAQFTSEALRRGEAKIPPGYKDYERKGGEGIGDYLLWFQMLDFATETKKPLLFVSTDVKDDWIRYQCGLAIGPRPELIKEMQTEAGVEYHQITLSELLARAGQALAVTVSQNTIDQAIERQSNEAKVSTLKNRQRALQDALAENSMRLKEIESIREFAQYEAAEATARIRKLESLLTTAEGDERVECENRLAQEKAELLAYSREMREASAQIRKFVEKELRLFAELRMTEHEINALF
ncbi:PIN-like domain-containing protein [Streptomyces humi]